MKALYIIAVLLITLTSCKKAKPETAQPKPIPVTENTPKADTIVFGIFCGECYKDCIAMYRYVTTGRASTLMYDHSSAYFGNREHMQFITPLTEPFLLNKAKEITAKIPVQLLKTTKQTETFGCPDCTDGCGLYVELIQNGKKKQFYIDAQPDLLTGEMKNFSAYLTAALVEMRDHQKSSVLNIPFRDVSEIPALKNYQHGGGALIDYDRTRQKDYKYAIAHYYSKANTFCGLELLIRGQNTKSRYIMLDTVNIGKLKKNEYLTYSSCLQDTTYDAQIIAIVDIGDGKAFYDDEYFEHVIRAWRADTATRKIIRIDNVKRLKCANEGYGAD